MLKFFWQCHRGKNIQILQRGAKCFQILESYVQFQPPILAIIFPLVVLQMGTFMFWYVYNVVNIWKTMEISISTSLRINLTVGTDSFTVSKHNLMSFSPFFQRIFLTNKQDPQEGEIKEYQHQQKRGSGRGSEPWANNVYQLLKLANCFQVYFLIKGVRLI